MSVDYNGKSITSSIVEASSPLHITVVATGTNEVDIQYMENGQDRSTVIAKLQTPNPKQKGGAQTYEYEWTPPSDFYGAYFWAVAKRGTQESASAQIDVKIKQ